MKPGFEGIAFQGVSRRAFLMSSGAAAVGIAFGGALAARSMAETMRL